MYVYFLGVGGGQTYVEANCCPESCDITRKTSRTSPSISTAAFGIFAESLRARLGGMVWPPPFSTLGRAASRTSRRRFARLMPTDLYSHVKEKECKGGEATELSKERGCTEGVQQEGSHHSLPMVSTGELKIIKSMI